MLFEDVSGVDDGVAPLNFDDITNARNPIVAPMRAAAVPGSVVPVDTAEVDSGVVRTAQLEANRDEVGAAREAVAAEAQRLRGADHYAALLIAPRATTPEVHTAYDDRLALLDRDAALLSDARVRTKLDEMRAAYAEARAVLSDERRRTTPYDRELAGGELHSVPPAIDTELGFRVAEELMSRRQWDQAIGHIKTVILRSPNEADYHAALGWAEWNANGAHAAAADGARQHLNHALSIDPDHAAAHDYKGRIDAALDADAAEAIFHLERALDLDPSRAQALATIEALLISKGELRRLERVLKRQLFRLRGSGGAAEALGWARLARLYLDHLDDAAAGATAAQHAAKLAPKHADIAQLVARVEAARQDAQSARRAGWREALEDTDAGAAGLVPFDGSERPRRCRLSRRLDDGRARYRRPHDGGALRAASRSRAGRAGAPARGGAMGAAPSPRGHARARQPVRAGRAGGARDRADDPRRGRCRRGRAARRRCASAGVREAARAAAFAGVLGVPMAPVYARVELGMQIHVVACDPPVMVAGDDALTSPERADLAFRVVRALTFTLPGRAVGASRPGRVLRAILLAVLRDASGGEIGAEEPLAACCATSPPSPRCPSRSACLHALRRCGCCRAAAPGSTCRRGRGRSRAPPTAPACCCARTYRRRSTVRARPATSIAISSSSRSAPRT